MCTLPDLFNRVRGTEDLGSSRAQEMEGLASGLPRWHHEYKGETEHPRGGSRKEESAVSEERAQPNTDVEGETLARRRQDNNGRHRPDQEEPDVLLDVENLEVEKITLEVDDLRAHISVLAELANLLNLSVGADVQLGRVKLEITGVRAQALLKVRLENVRAILVKALETLGEHPEILENLAQTLTALLREALQDASSALGDVLEGLDVGDAVDEVLKGRLEDISSDLQGALEGQGDDTTQRVGEVTGGTTGRGGQGTRGGR